MNAVIIAVLEEIMARGRLLGRTTDLAGTTEFALLQKIRELKTHPMQVFAACDETSLWMARDKNGDCYLYDAEPKLANIGATGLPLWIWTGAGSAGTYMIDIQWLPELDWKETKRKVNIMFEVIE